MLTHDVGGDFHRKPDLIDATSSRQGRAGGKRMPPAPAGGGERVRTDDPLLAKQVLSQLSYTPNPPGLRRALTCTTKAVGNGPGRI